MLGIIHRTLSPAKSEHEKCIYVNTVHIPTQWHGHSHVVGHLLDCGQMTVQTECRATGCKSIGYCKKPQHSGQYPLNSSCQPNAAVKQCQINTKYINKCQASWMWIFAILHQQPGWCYNHISIAVFHDVCDWLLMKNASLDACENAQLTERWLTTMTNGACGSQLHKMQMLKK